MSQRESYEAVIAWNMDAGAPGTDKDTENPLSRSMRHLFRTGKPFSEIRLCFFDDGTSTTSVVEAMRWFGVFVETSSNRIVYFPGIEKKYDRIQGIHGKSLQWDQAFDFDHITLEKNGYKWHVTSPESKYHLGSPRTLPLEKGRYLWFGMSVADPNILRSSHMQTHAVFECPPSDTRRRLDTVKTARDKATFNIISLNTENKLTHDNHFLHFGVIVGSKGFDLYKGGELGFPVGSPFLQEPLPARLDSLAVRHHRIQFSNFDLQITSCLLPGSLKVPFSLTGPNARTID
ncbi:hypothetical protein ACFL1S_00995 [Pseudomonadota bacterium]